MQRTVTMHQPNYLPWIGLFAKINLSDCLIIYDSAQYEKNGVINRNKIRTGSGSLYLTIPVGKLPVDTRISDIVLPRNNKWKQQHWRTIYQNYAKAPFFNIHAAFFENLYKQDLPYLRDFNEEILFYLLSCFEINVKTVRTSTLNVDPALRKTDLMLAYMTAVGTSTYISGPSGKNYLETDRFAASNIALKFIKFEHPVYKQRYPGFEPNLSAIDLLFNLGPESLGIIKQSACIEELSAVERR
jgi:hypothetical protein